MRAFFIAIAALIALTEPGGHPIDVNPSDIVSLRPPRGQGHFTGGANCLITTADGKFISVTEDCAKVLNLIEQ
jgi:hypothetical protein